MIADCRNVGQRILPRRSNSQADSARTGRLPSRSGTWKVAAPGEPQGMAPWEYTIAELLSDTGYATAMHGKWHIGDRDGRLPNDQGYDEWYGTKESAMEAKDHYEVRGWSSGCWCAFCTFAFLSVLFLSIRLWRIDTDF